MKRVTSYVLLLLLAVFAACSTETEPQPKPDPQPDPTPDPVTEQHLMITHVNGTMLVPELSGKNFEAWVMWNTGMDWEAYKAGTTHTYTVDAPYRLEIKGSEINEVSVKKITGISILDFSNF